MRKKILPGTVAGTRYQVVHFHERMILYITRVQLFAKKNATGNLAHEKKKNVCVFFNNNNTPPSLTKATRTQAIDHQITSTVA